MVSPKLLNIQTSWETPASAIYLADGVATWWYGGVDDICVRSNSAVQRKLRLNFTTIWKTFVHIFKPYKPETSLYHYCGLPILRCVRADSLAAK